MKNVNINKENLREIGFKTTIALGAIILVGGYFTIAARTLTFVDGSYKITIESNNDTSYRVADLYLLIDNTSQQKTLVYRKNIEPRISTKTSFSEDAAYNYYDIRTNNLLYSTYSLPQNIEVEPLINNIPEFNPNDVFNDDYTEKIEKYVNDQMTTRKM